MLPVRKGNNVAVTVGDAIRSAVEERNAAKAAKIADFLRFNRGLNYNQTVRIVNHAVGRDASGEWEALMYEADTGYA